MLNIKGHRMTIRRFAWFVTLPLAFVLFGFVLAGCKVESPISGKQADAKQLAQEWGAYEAKQKAAAQEAAAKAQEIIADAEADAKLALTKLKARTDIETADIEAAFAKVVRQAEQSSAATLARIDAAMSETKARMDAAVETVNSQNAVLERILGMGLAAGEAIPGGAPFVSIASVLLAVAGLGTAAKKAREAKENETATRSMVNAIDLLRAKNPAVAEAMKTAKADLVGQLTDRARKLIAEERLT